MGFGEGSSALLSQTPKYLRTWDGLSKPIPVRIEGNLDITTPMRTELRRTAPASEGKTSKNITNKNIKNGKMGKILCWNKGNSSFMVKKPELEIMISDHKPLKGYWR